MLVLLFLPFLSYSFTIGQFLDNYISRVMDQPELEQAIFCRNKTDNPHLFNHLVENIDNNSICLTNSTGWLIPDFLEYQQQLLQHSVSGMNMYLDMKTIGYLCIEKQPPKYDLQFDWIAIKIQTCTLKDKPINIVKTAFPIWKKTDIVEVQQVERQPLQEPTPNQQMSDQTEQPQALQQPSSLSTDRNQQDQL